MIDIRETNEGVTVKIKVQPKASKNEIAGKTGDALKVRLTAPPVDGSANNACTDFFADLFGLPKSAVKILSGHTGRNKLIEIRGVNREQFMKQCNLS